MYFGTISHSIKGVRLHCMELWQYLYLQQKSFILKSIWPKGTTGMCPGGLQGCDNHTLRACTSCTEWVITAHSAASAVDPSLHAWSHFSIWSPLKPSILPSDKFPDSLNIRSKSAHGGLPWTVSSVAQSCPTLWDPMDCSMPGFPVQHELPELTQTHVHWVGDAIQPFHPLLSPSPPAFNLPQHQGLFQWVGSSNQVAKVLEFQLQHQSFQWIFRIDFL